MKYTVKTGTANSKFILECKISTIACSLVLSLIASNALPTTNAAFTKR